MAVAGAGSPPPGRSPSLPLGTRWHPLLPSGTARQNLHPAPCKWRASLPPSAEAPGPDRGCPGSHRALHRAYSLARPRPQDPQGRWSKPTLQISAHQEEVSLGLPGKGRQEKREEDGVRLDWQVDASSTPSLRGGICSPKVSPEVRRRPVVPVSSLPVAQIFATFTPAHLPSAPTRNWLHHGLPATHDLWDQI